MADNKGTYLIRTQCAAVPSYAETGGGGWTMDAVKQMLSSLDPGHVATVGQAYTDAADALTTAADRLHQHAQRLVEAWTGENADRALKQLGQLNTTAAELQEKSATTGQVYSWLGTEILPWYKAEGEKMGHGYISDSGDDKAAVELLDRMDNRILQGYNGVPDSISKDLPPHTKSGVGDLGIPDTGRTPTGRQPPGGTIVPPTAGAPGSLPGQHGVDPGGTPAGVPGGPGAGTVHDSGPGAVPGAGLPGAGVPAAGGTDLAGAGGGAGVDPFGAGGIGGGAGGAAGGLGGGPGGLGGGPGGVGGVLAPGTPGSLGAGRGGAGAAPGGSATRGAGGRPGGGAPMGGGGHGKEEEERERTTWLTEDEDIWTDDGDVAPPVIG
jgi:hypothetical protein